MPLKTLLVHLDHDDVDARLAMAVSLARQHEARLIGLFAERGEARKVGIVGTWPSESYREAAAASRAAFARATEGLSGVEWRDAARGSPAEVVRAVAQAAHAADLILMGQDEGAGQHHASVPPGMAEQVILHAGTPALILPGAGRFERVGRRPLIAWKDSREAARALKDALPLIAGAEEAVVVTFVAKPDDEREAVEQALHYLTDHRIRARSECLVVDGVGIMDMLLNRAADLGSDLLVMGAHSHYGFPHMLRGNGTRHVLSAMTLPVLMSN
ncbi:universal stress protein [Azospirillum endophyticum]